MDWWTQFSGPTGVIVTFFDWVTWIVKAGLIRPVWIRAGYITRVAYKLKSAKKSKTGYFENVYN